LLRRPHKTDRLNEVAEKERVHGGEVMGQHRLMSGREKADIFRKSRELKAAGRVDEATALYRTVPVPAYLAKIFKGKVGADFLIQGG
jgi:hypothetical protein